MVTFNLQLTESVLGNNFLFYQSHSTSYNLKKLIDNKTSHYLFNNFNFLSNYKKKLIEIKPKIEFIITAFVLQNKITVLLKDNDTDVIFMVGLLGPFIFAYINTQASRTIIKFSE